MCVRKIIDGIIFMYPTVPYDSWEHMHKYIYIYIYIYTKKENKFNVFFFLVRYCVISILIQIERIDFIQIPYQAFDIRVQSTKISNNGLSNFSKVMKAFFSRSVIE